METFHRASVNFTYKRPGLSKQSNTESTWPFYFKNSIPADHRTIKKIIEEHMNESVREKLKEWGRDRGYNAEILRVDISYESEMKPDPRAPASRIISIDSYLPQRVTLDNYMPVPGQATS